MTRDPSKAWQDWRAVLAAWPEHDRIDWAERAAIIEYEAGKLRAEAERIAFEMEQARRRSEGSG